MVSGGSVQMTMNRRHVLRSVGLGGGGLVLLAAGGLAWRGYQRGSFADLTGGPAFEPWRQWRDARPDGLEAVALAGTLASNPHDSQPWLFRIGDGSIDLLADRRRQMPVVDPFGRELTIGLGCAIENMVIASQGLGLAASVTLLPEAAPAETMMPDHVARLVFTPTPVPATPSPRYAAIGARHTHRGAYARQELLPMAALKALNSLQPAEGVGLILYPAGNALGRRFIAGTVAATEAFIATPALSADSARWFRQTRAAIDQHRDGIAITSGGRPDWQVRAAMALPDFDAASIDQAWLTDTREVHCATAPVFGAIRVVRRDDPRLLLEAGRLWQRLHLEATALGLAAQPLNQMMEMADQEARQGTPAHFMNELNILLHGAEGHIIFGFRLGRPLAPAVPSPRRPLANVLT